MPLVKVEKSVKDILRDCHSDMAVNIGSIHDELSFIVDKFLFKPIMTEVTKIASLDDVIKKISGIGFIRFKLDAEYDDFGSYTAEKQFDQYEYNMLSLLKMDGFDVPSSDDDNEEENHLNDDDRGEEENQSNDGGREELYVHEFKSYDEFLSMLPNIELVKGKTIVSINGETFMYVGK